MTELTKETLHFNSPWTESITEILGVHMHRYLMPLLMDHKINSLGVMVGFEVSSMPSVALRVTTYGAETTEIAVDYASLISEARSHEDLATVITREVDGKNLYFYPILSISEPGREHIHAFVVSDKEGIYNADIMTVALRTRINEAIRAFRHNSLLIVFDECENSSPREFLDRILDLIPIWCGSDHSACLMLSSSLEAMVLSGVGPAHFQIVNEKLYCSPKDDDKAFENLSSLEFVVNYGENSGLIGHAFEEVRRSKSVGLNIFIGDDSDEWFSMGECQKSAHRVATRSYRPKEKMTVLLPLLCSNEVGEQELLGFLSINFFEPMPLSSLTSRVLETLATRLGTYLHRSSFFSLSAQQLWLLECVREEQVAVSRLFRNAKDDRKDMALQAFIKNVNGLVAQSTRIPCFAIGYRTTDAEGNDILRFRDPHGFTIFDNIDLAVYPENRAESSLSTLAVRLNRVITLSGGEMKDGRTAFLNEIYVNESRGVLADGRLEEKLGDDWRKLSEYYKPSREGSYAALCYPIRMKDDVVGVIAVEVDRDTDWVWWTGFGSYLFYRLLANEFAADFSLLGLDVPET